MWQKTTAVHAKPRRFERFIQAILLATTINIVFALITQPNSADIPFEPATDGTVIMERIVAKRERSHLERL
jgi:hypothetical protein